MIYLVLTSQFFLNNEKKEEEKCKIKTHPLAAHGRDMYKNVCVKL